METVLGKLTNSTERDAIHIAVAPIKAKERLKPGQHVGIDGTTKNPIGIVDPFLTEDVYLDDTFYLCLYPGSVTGIKHHWFHPGFDSENRVWFESFAARIGKTYGELMEHAETFCRRGETHHNGDDERYGDVNWGEFWERYTAITGLKPEYIGAPYSCSC